MASIMRTLGKMDLAMGPGLVGVVVDGGVGFGASYVLGRVYAQYGKDHRAARNAARLSAIVGKAGAVVLSLFGAPQVVTGVVNSAGQAGLNAIGLEMGLKKGREKIGKRAVLVDKGASIPGASDIGALGRARGGAGPTWEQIAEMAGAR